MNKNPTTSDDKLLRRESYIRRERSVAFSLAAGGILSFIAAATDAIPKDGLYPALAAALFFLVYGDSCSLRLRHIQSIKYYRGMLTPGQS
jgi:hypothetical protein